MTRRAAGLFLTALVSFAGQSACDRSTPAPREEAARAAEGGKNDAPSDDVGKEVSADAAAQGLTDKAPARPSSTTTQPLRRPADVAIGNEVMVAGTPVAIGDEAGLTMALERLVQARKKDAESEDVQFDAIAVRADPATPMPALLEVLRASRSLGFLAFDLETMHAKSGQPGALRITVTPRQGAQVLPQSSLARLGALPKVTMTAKGLEFDDAGSTTTSTLAETSKIEAWARQAAGTGPDREWVFVISTAASTSVQDLVALIDAASGPACHDRIPTEGTVEHHGMEVSAECLLWEPVLVID